MYGDALDQADLVEEGLIDYPDEMLEKICIAVDHGLISSLDSQGPVVIIRTTCASYWMNHSQLTPFLEELVNLSRPHQNRMAVGNHADL